MQELGHIVVGGVDAQLFGLDQQNLLLHQLLANLLLEDAHDHRVVGVLRVAPLQLLAGELANRCWLIVTPEEKKRLYQWG